MQRLCLKLCVRLCQFLNLEVPIERRILVIAPVTPFEIFGAMVVSHCEAVLFRMVF
jgi:hypothetical protein